MKLIIVSSFLAITGAWAESSSPYSTLDTPDKRVAYAACMRRARVVMGPQGINENNMHEFCLNLAELGWDWKEAMKEYE